MSRISQAAMVAAIRGAQALDLQGSREALADEVFYAQPNLLASVLVLPRLGVALSKADFALDMLFACFLAMKASNSTWPSSPRTIRTASCSALWPSAASATTSAPVFGNARCSNILRTTPKRRCSPT